MKQIATKHIEFQAHDPNRGRRLRNELRVPTPALNAWRHEVARGVRTTKNFDALWAAGCEDLAAVEPYFSKIFRSTHQDQSPRLTLFLKGTNFQIKVWEALLRIPP